MSHRLTIHVGDKYSVTMSRASGYSDSNDVICEEDMVRSQIDSEADALHELDPQSGLLVFVLD